MHERGQRVYVWEFPVRLTHWINVICLVVLSLTGFYIGKPFLHSISSDQYTMGWMRFIHFVSAYLFLMSIIVRLYWIFAGNRYARYDQWLPLNAERWRHLLGGIKFYLFIKRDASYTAGHTALAGATYTFLFGLFLFEVVSGFALYSLNHTGLIWTALGGWLLSVMHLQTIRLFHHLLMYLILLIGVVHIYIAWYLGTWEKSGLMDSIFSGYKFRKDE